MKLIILMLSFLMLACGPREIGTIKNGNAMFKIICIDGVEYLSRKGGYAGYLTGHFKPDGTLYTCNET